jgi:hypothetical protein
MFIIYLAFIKGSLYCLNFLLQVLSLSQSKTKVVILNFYEGYVSMSTIKVINQLWLEKNKRSIKKEQNVLVLIDGLLLSLRPF